MDAAKQVGGQAQLAKHIGVTPAAISQVVSGNRRLPPDRCPSVERATSGKVTVEQLRPDIRWHRVPDPDWPHPLGRPLIDVVAPAAAEARDAA